jgi:Flp pilus assembly protein TadD
MTGQSELEIKGNFLAHPFAELLAEIASARLNGSLRVSNNERKCVIYFKGGRVVFAVSNAKSSRLFDILLKRGKLSKEDLTKIPNFQNDLELSTFLKEKQLLNKRECDKLFADQIEKILVDVLAWKSGEWMFSYLARVRDGLEFDVDVTRLLAESGCQWPSDHIRSDRQPAFSAEKIESMRSARLEIKREAKVAGVAEPASNGAGPGREKADTSVAGQNVKREPEISLSLEDYLKRVESAETYYDILGVDPKAEIGELKKAYFALARKFHPDRYHADGGETLARVQQAFGQLAQAHETLKNPEMREVYDYRARRELADREEARKAGETGSGHISLQYAQASESFERGHTLLMDGDAEAAVPFLARAAHYNPKDARYHAYYGKALAADEKQRHKAEGELQAALKIDPANKTFRLMLAEFFIQYNLPKRAEGEIKRVLALAPDNREALNLLAGLKGK